MSDLHLDYLTNTLRKAFLNNLDEWLADLPKRPEVLVVAGDTGEMGAIKNRYITYECIEKLCFLFPNVVLVAGNHDHAGTSISKVKDDYRALSHRLTNFHPLMNSEVTINSQRFLGGVGWYPDCEDVLMKQYFYDYRAIDDFEPEVYEENRKFNELVSNSTLNDVVVSHHAPSYQSVHARFQGAPSNVFFINPIDDILLKAQPKLFVHGHVHHSFDYKLGNTRVYVNPFGYYKEDVNPNFWNQILVEV